MVRVAAILLLVALAAPLAHAAFCSGKPSPDAPSNNIPIHTAPPVFSHKVKNGAAYVAGQGDDSFWLLHVYGTPYDMGYAHGKLMKEEVSNFINEVWAYMETQVEQALDKFPSWFQDIVAAVGMDAALDATAAATGKYIDSDFFEELRGLADATGVYYERALRVHLVAELTKGDCSMFGMWGEATKGGKTLQLRALDWDVQGPFRNYAAVIVYHPTTVGQPWANVGFLGFIGSVTGMNAHQMAISEIGVSYPDATFGKESRFGVPFVIMLRDILYKDTKLHDSLVRMRTKRRTCHLILGVGDGKDGGAFRGVQYGYEVAKFMTDKNQMPLNATWHPRIKDTVYWGMDWLCPNYSEVLAKQIRAKWGEVTPENAISDIIAHTQTGNLHIAVYDLTDQYMYVAHARKASVTTGSLDSWARQYTKLDMPALFSREQSAYEMDL